LKVLVIPEDQELDRYVVKPVIEALFKDLGRPARIDVLPEPRLRGASDALDGGMIDEIVAENPMVDLFLLIVDADCDRDGNRTKVAARATEHEGRLIACVAEQEVEVWLLALYKEELGVQFSKVRQHCDPKEEWAEPLLEKLGTGSPGRGRKAAMRRLSGAYRSLRDTCTELRVLENSIRAWLETAGA
jgi:hypothetical protein